MAKIALVASHLSGALRSLAQTLIEQNQEVLIVTSADEVVNFDLKCEIIAPFRSWSLKETPRLIQIFLTSKVDIVHFVFGARKDRVTQAHWILAAAFSNWPNIKTLVSVFDQRNVYRWQDRLFFSLVNSLTFGTRSQLMESKRGSRILRHKLMEVLPPLPGTRFQKELEESREPEIEKFIAKLGHFILSPSGPTQASAEAFKEVGFEVLSFHKTRKKDREHYELSRLSEKQLNYCLEKSRSLFLADSELSLLELQRYASLAHRIEKPLIVNQRQAEVLPGLCLHKRTGWIIGGPECLTLDLLLKSNSNLKLNWLPAEGFSIEEKDASANLLMRLYLRSPSWL